MTTTAFSIELTRKSLRVTNAWQVVSESRDPATRKSVGPPLDASCRGRTEEEKSNEIEHCGSGEGQAS